MSDLADEKLETGFLAVFNLLPDSEEAWSRLESGMAN